MGVRVRAFLWLLTAIFFAYDVYVWGGLEATPVIGKELMREAPFQSPLAATYMFLGRKINGTLGTREKSQAFAAKRFPELVAHPENARNLAVYRFLQAQSFSGTLMYYGFPVLLVLSFVAHAMRQKRIHSFGTGG
jgi:hypothetical protein